MCRNGTESLPLPYRDDREIFVRTGARSLSGILVLINPQPTLNSPVGFQ